MFGFPFAFLVQIAAAFVADIRPAVIPAAIPANVQTPDILVKTDILEMPVDNVPVQRLEKPEQTFHHM